MSGDSAPLVVPAAEADAVRPPKNVLEGHDEAVCKALQVKKLRYPSAALELCGRAQVPRGFVQAGYEVVADNWRRCRALGVSSKSAQNWRWRFPQTRIGAQNTSAELMLERAISEACERVGSDWANQVPIASGVAGPYGERRRAVDLVHRLAPAHFELIELKVASDSPLHAAIEIIGYCCVWLLSREPGSTNPLLSATQIDAVVLAPARYYARYRLQALEARLDEELAALGRAQGVDLRFRFEAFADELGQSPFTDERIAALLASRRRL
jgi:hypothetical protein